VLASVIFIETSHAGEFVRLDPMQGIAHFTLDD